jgi:plastocyanin
VFQGVTLGATATVSAGGFPLASVEIEVSEDNGATWTSLAANTHPSSPSDSESLSHAFVSAGTASLRATATDTHGLTASSAQTVAVGRAGQGALALIPAVSSLTAGQSIAFSASGGATGNYSWGGAASGSGSVQTVTFPAPGTYAVTVVDSGDSNYSPSAPASATITVADPFFTLSAAASAGGTVTGGGSYPQNSLATAVATAGPGEGFAGWTGDATGEAPSISLVMNANKSITAHFFALLSQTISFVPPAGVTTRTPAFPLSVTSSSGLPVTLALVSGPATLAAATVTPSGATGEVVLLATQPGNADYLPAPPVLISFAVGLPPPGVLLTDASSATKRSDRTTRVTSLTSAQAH